MIRPTAADPAAPGRAGAGHLMGLFTALTFGSSYPVGKPVVESVDPLAFSAGRYLLAAIVLLAVLAMVRGGARVAVRDLPTLAWLGFLGFGLFPGVWAIALAMTSPGKAAVLIATTPVFGAIIAALIGENLSPRGWLGVLVAFAGVFVVINDSFTEIRLGGGTLLGDVLFVALAALWAVYGWLSRRTVIRLGAFRTAGWAALFGSLTLAPLGLWGAVRQDWAAVDPALWANFLYVAIVVGCLGIASWNGGLARLGLARMTTWLYVSPVFAVVISGVMLGEWLTAAQAAGAVTVLVGVALTQTAPRPLRAPAD